MIDFIIGIICGFAVEHTFADFINNKDGGKTNST